VAASALGDPASTPLTPGAVLPPLAGQTLSGKPLDLPAAARGRAAVVIFSFSRAGGRDARIWASRLAEDEPHLPRFTVIFLQSVPRLFRGIVTAELTKAMPPDVRDRTAIVDCRQSLWEERLHLTNESDACVLMLGPAGHVRWISCAPFAETLYQRLREQVNR
jgi:hypothetical protein